ncbi:N-acetylmuramoyl-L-alanine amidase [Novosphingobium sp. YJ-S2-02]|uniref:N-acetylmuramoyl-L-alanine amidase n=1 Tax=Novosphingobium aureum TaxID=2792964 RepID=A0A931HCP9_9SPHN|nr:N-acetylmuramoyl-L-alanine amidase [Novosphingobium aureum]MBH0113024.1 N-acetylmuramoyl-L-alanine amidase [Novosphingobium aureum]
MARLFPIILLIMLPLLALGGVLAMMVSGRMSHEGAQAGQSFVPVLRFTLPSTDEPVGLPRVDGPPDASRPLVVIDPGHGGFDPGAGKGALREKTVALNIARALRDHLVRSGGIRVAMTRDSDRFIALRDRPEIARRMGADLFVSIHADSAESDLARGASVYVLSQKGTGEAAERFASSARETGRSEGGRVNGIVLADTDDMVGAILLDLSQRSTQSDSTALAQLVLRELSDDKVPLHRENAETAALAVLKAPDIPSILFETGYINNEQDAELLGSRKGQERLGAAAARAIRAFFARKLGA